MKHFLDLSDWSSKDLRQMIRLAQQLKLEWQSGGNRPVLAGKTLGMIFQKPSLRTRVSFDVGMQHFGGHAIMLGPEEIGLGKRESIAETARLVVDVMEHAYELKAPLRANAEIGTNWRDMEPVKR